MRRSLVLYWIICLIILACTACSSAPGTKTDNVSHISFGLAETGEISRLRGITQNPFIEYRSAFFKSNEYFLVFKLEANDVRDDIRIEPIELSSGGTHVYSKVMLRDDLLEYWNGFLAGDAAYVEMRSTIERYVPVSMRIRASRKALTRYLVISVSKAEARIDGWKATITVNDEDIEFSGSM